MPKVIQIDGKKVEVLTSREAAVILDCSPDDLYMLADTGQVLGGYHRQGRNRRWYTKQSVLAYRRRLNRRKGEPTNE